MKNSEIGSLPPEAEMNREDALDAFLAVLNTVEPEHPYTDDPYPLSRDGVNYGVTRTYFAKCGPNETSNKYIVNYSTRLTYINEISRERHLALLTHEVTHVTVGNYTSKQHGAHPPRFWKEAANNAVTLREALADGSLLGTFGFVDIGAFNEEIVADVTRPVVDRRYGDVEEYEEGVRSIIYNSGS